MDVHVPSGGGEEQKENGLTPGSGPRWCHPLQQDTQKGQAVDGHKEESSEAEGTSEIRIWNLGAGSGPELEVVRIEVGVEVVGADEHEQKVKRRH